MNKLIEKVTANVDFRDVLVFGGIGLAAWGIALIHLPAALIFSGLACFWLGIRR